jgi:hypothetical protein
MNEAQGPRGVAKPIRGRQLVLIAIAVVVLIGVFISERGKESKPNRVPVKKTELNQHAIRFATSALTEDLIYAASRKSQSQMTQQEALVLAKIDLAVTANTFAEDYEANELAGDSKYKHKRFILSGEIESIEKDFTENGVLTLRSGNVMGVHARLNARGTSGALTLSRGSKVFLVCDSSDRVVRSEIAGNCERLSQYTEELRPQFEQTVTQFLAGSIVLPKNIAAEIVAGYVMASHLPTDSSCLARLEDCDSQINKLKNDAAQVRQISAEIKDLNTRLLTQ